MAFFCRAQCPPLRDSSPGEMVGTHFPNNYNILLRAVVSGKNEKTSRNFMSERVPHVQNSRKGHQILAASPPILRAGFTLIKLFEFFFIPPTACQLEGSRGLF